MTGVDLNTSEPINTEALSHIVSGMKEITNDISHVSMGRRSSSDSTFPDPVAQEAYYGIIGDITQAIEPHTEAHPAAILITALTACGAVLGRGPHYLADGARHGTNLYVCMVGDSGKGRKGTSWKRVRSIVEQAADPEFSSRIESGLSSGEGLINLVRDPRNIGKEHDPGVSDKRLLIVESEFSSPLKVMRREGNTLSPVIRNAWDGDRLRTATKNFPLAATEPHIAMIGHITREELSRSIGETEAANGFGNRYLWTAVRRSKCLPLGGNLDERTVEILVTKLRDAFTKGRRNLSYKFDVLAERAWIEIYPALSEGKPGLLGAMIARGEAQVIRLAMLYAALDGAGGEIRPEHLNAALAVWEYCEQSARWTFGGRLGDPLADTILEALGAHPAGMTRTNISDYLCRNTPAERITTALQFLCGHGRAEMRQEKSEGAVRPVERWFANTK